jgi:2-dehydro-3-deoxyphosphogluconate aldolase / (4S)-4-hydroxy-2-oxoglutarate aldolase
MAESGGGDLPAALRARRLLGIIRGRDPDASVRTAVALAEEGVDLLEVSLTGADAPAVRGAAAVKIFPAGQYGPGYVRALRDPFPAVPLVPVGGLGAEHVGEYLTAGAVAVGVGSPLTGDAPHGGDLTALRERARRFLDAVAPWTT